MPPSPNTPFNTHWPKEAEHVPQLLILGAIAALFTIVTIVPASAIGIQKGNGETMTVLDPANLVEIDEILVPTGVSYAHGPSCDAFGGCENHESATAFDHAFVNLHLTADMNFGGWNGVFQNNSPEGKGICGIWATNDEAAAAGEAGAPTCES